MISILLGMVLGAQAVPERPPDPCAPRVNLTRGGPPPAVFRARRLHSLTRAAMDLSVHRCDEDGVLRIERHRRDGEQAGGSEPPSQRDWLTTRQCPQLLVWVRQAEALELAPPADAPLEELGQPAVGLWYILSGRTATGGGLLGRLEVEVRQAEGAAPNPLSRWVEDGERLFQRCRDAGQGDTRWLRPGRPE